MFETLHECEECWSVVPVVTPCYSWDRNSAMVCPSCRVRINSERPGGDE